MSQKLPESPEKAKQQASRRETQRASTYSFQAGLHPTLQLQRTLGNRQVSQLIKARRLTPEGRIIALQPRLTVGAADDQYEQEADRVARQVVSMPDSAILASSPQTSPVEGDAGQHHTLQSKPLPLAASITPFVQRQIGAEEESEEGQDKEEDKEGLLQGRFLNKSTALPLRRQSAAEVEDAEKAEPIQTRAAGSLSDSFEAGDDVESRLNQSKGGGSQLPESVRAYMEPRFGADFSHVRVHTGSEAIQMNRDVGAQAFTHGSDIYYGAGSSPSNLELTAHELTHVVQQGEARTVDLNGEPFSRTGASALTQRLVDTLQRYPGCSLEQDRVINDALLRARRRVPRAIAAIANLQSGASSHTAALTRYFGPLTIAQIATIRSLMEAANSHLNDANAWRCDTGVTFPQCGPPHNWCAGTLCPGPSTPTHLCPPVFRPEHEHVCAEPSRANLILHEALRAAGACGGFLPPGPRVPPGSLTNVYSYSQFMYSIASARREEP